MSDTLSPFGPGVTDDPIYADERNFFKVEAWTADGNNIRALIHAGNRLDQSQKRFAVAKKHRPAGRYTIRQRSRVLAKWPEV
jgi:hypothetical protein